MKHIFQRTSFLFPKNMLYIYLVILLIYALVFMVKDYEKNIQLNILEIIFICVAFQSDWIAA